MHFAKLISLGLLLLVGDSVASSCRNPPLRKEWRELSIRERRDYIGAVRCLAARPAVTSLENVVTHFDDFQATHSDQTPNIHWVGHFVLWHRYYLATYEKALREECGYRGGQPYWNWSLDASSTDNSSMAIFETDVFHPTRGFGGNGKYLPANETQNPLNLTGRTGGGCVEDGPFTPPNFMLAVGHPKGQPDCLRRDFIPSIMNYFSRQSLVDHVLAQPDYTTFARALENIPAFTQPNIHGSGHFGVGGALGTLGNQALSPGDPLFYLHHGNVDRVFWEWQQKDLPTRYHQVGGPVNAMDYSGVNVTLDFEINIGKLAPNATLESLLNTKGGTLCYSYWNKGKH
ncbi:uncharacterized protein N7479_002519 [Penicillium vulpinum]|uniref:Tyrosinase copper-binding domain-containing protein n=1 Tax=Penicillium vulpinum TaxID=29845 RepID=A0A1V6RI42_9EURO|nr:uncharacterized protein N7479_002519 [Penicillium vulpinum]KAJ5972601.1 hypothetical protein N7479_002519 [Penicillium vulpinum]OQE01168.1 hypothetical protein PENVUL_c044G06972 [Penicillium vulpinum]